MAQAINKGTNFQLFEVEVTTTAKQVILNEKFNSIQIQCRTAVDLELKESAGATKLFTIKSGTILELDYANRNLEPFSLRAGSSVIAEIIGIKEKL